MRTLILVALLCTLTGCVSARLKTYERTTTAPDGTMTKEKGREIAYTDAREAAKGAQEFMALASGGIGIFLSSIGTEGLVGGATGIGGLGAGLLWLGRKLGRAKGRDEGWDEREKAATVQQELPARRTLS